MEAVTPQLRSSMFALRSPNPTLRVRPLTGALSSDPQYCPRRVALRRHVNRRQVDRFDGRPDHDWWGHVSYVEPDPLRWRVSLSLFR